jgi:hypothetical protein
MKSHKKKKEKNKERKGLDRWTKTDGRTKNVRTRSIVFGLRAKGEKNSKENNKTKKWKKNKFFYLFFFFFYVLLLLLPRVTNIGKTTRPRNVTKHKAKQNKNKRSPCAFENSWHVEKQKIILFLHDKYYPSRTTIYYLPMCVSVCVLENQKNSGGTSHKLVTNIIKIRKSWKVFCVCNKPAHNVPIGREGPSSSVRCFRSWSWRRCILVFAGDCSKNRRSWNKSPSCRSYWNEWCAIFVSLFSRSLTFARRANSSSFKCIPWS